MLLSLPHWRSNAIFEPSNDHSGVVSEHVPLVICVTAAIVMSPVQMWLTLS
jgi:hypothetical protein